MSSFAVGGLAAGAVALWGQVRSFLVWLSSFIVLTAELDELLAQPAAMVFYREFKAAPSGLLHFAAKWVYLHRESREILVPYLLPSATGIYYRRGTVLFVSHLGRPGMTLRTLRGTVDFHALITEFVRAKEEEHAALAVEYAYERTNRFAVHAIMGAEKGFGAFAQSASNRHDDNAAGERPVGAGPAPTAIGYQAAAVPELYHESFMYSREVYTGGADRQPFRGLYFDSEVLAYVDQARQWYVMRDWYIERSIPWRRGWLLYGPGGTGKSSLAQAIAQELGIPLVHFHLSTLSDGEFLRAWRSLSTPCIVLFEELDAVFNGRENVTEHKTLSFDTVLNAVSGVDGRFGVFLVVTTNHIDRIDPAMGVPDSATGESSRAGRIDTVIRIGAMSKHNQRRMAEHILRDWPDAIEQVLAESAAAVVTPAQFQERCLQIAFDRLAKDPLQLKLAA